MAVWVRKWNACHRKLVTVNGSQILKAINQKIPTCCLKLCKNWHEIRTLPQHNPILKSMTECACFIIFSLTLDHNSFLINDNLVTCLVLCKPLVYFEPSHKSGFYSIGDGVKTHTAITRHKNWCDRFGPFFAAFMQFLTVFLNVLWTLFSV